MARKIKHSKIKNTGILFELLTRQITADVLAGKSTKSVGILKKFFNEKTELGKELELYKLLSEKNYNSEVKANDLLNVVIKQRQNLNNSDLRREKYNLISSIKENYNVTDFFNGRIPNYRLLASIYNIFQSETTDEKFKADQLVNSKLLKNYINNISNTNSLREYVDKEVTRIKSVLKKELPRVDDKITSIKLTEAINQIENLTKGKIVNEKQVLSLMRYYELIKEIRNVHEG